MKLSGLTLLIFTLPCYTLLAQVTQQINIVIVPSAELRVSEDSPHSTAFRFVSAEEMENGLTKQNAASYEVYSNTGWMVSAKARNPYFDDVEAGESSLLPSHVLSVRGGRDTRADFMPLSEAGVEILSGERNSPEHNNRFSLDYQAQPGIEYKPGTYALDVLLTITGI